MSPTDIPPEGRVLYPQIPARTSVIDSASREGSPVTGPSRTSNPITLEDIYSHMVALQQAQVTMQIENKKQRQADREALDSMINNLSYIMSENDGPRGHSAS